MINMRRQLIVKISDTRLWSVRKEKQLTDETSTEPRLSVVVNRVTVPLLFVVPLPPAPPLGDVEFPVPDVALPKPALVGKAAAVVMRVEP